MTTEMETRDPAPVAVRPPSHLDFLLNPAIFDHLWRVATGYSKSALVPTHFRGKPEDCFVAVQLAMRLGTDPFMLMQGLYVVSGRPGMEAKLAIALANERGPFSGRIRYELSGDGPARQCTAYAFLREGGERVEQTVTLAIAKAYGWTNRADSTWNKAPDLMLQYRSASWLIRTYCPEVLMGLQTRDELEDGATVIDVPAIAREPGQTKTEAIGAYIDEARKKTRTKGVETESTRADEIAMTQYAREIAAADDAKLDSLDEEVRNANSMSSSVKVGVHRMIAERRAALREKARGDDGFDLRQERTE